MACVLCNGPHFRPTPVAGPPVGRRPDATPSTATPLRWCCSVLVMSPKRNCKRPVSPAPSAAGASGSGQQVQGQGQAAKVVIRERRQVIKAGLRGLVKAALPDLSPAQVDAIVAEIKKRMTMGSKQCCLTAVILPSLCPPPLQQLAAATPAGTTLDGLHAHILALKATWDALWEEYLKPRWRRQRLGLHHVQDRVIEAFCKKVVNGMKWGSRHHYHQERGVAVYLGAGRFSQGGWKANAVREGFRKVVEQPSRPGLDRPDRLVIVDEFRTTRVSSSVHARQPCELHLPNDRPRPADWVPPAGQGNQRLLRPAWSLRHSKDVRGLKWCHEVPPNPPPPPPAQHPPAQDPPPPPPAQHPPAQDPPAPAQDPPAPAQDPPPPAQDPPPPPPAQEPPPPAQDLPPAQAPPGPAPRPQAPPWGRWLDRDTNPCLNFQRIGESMQRPIELCSYEGLKALPPIGKEYQQGYKRVNDRLPKVKQRLHRAAEYRRVSFVCSEAHHHHPGHLGRGVGDVPGPQVGTAAAEAVRGLGPGYGAVLQEGEGGWRLEEKMAEVSMKRHQLPEQLVLSFGAAGIGTGGGPKHTPPARCSRRTKAEQAVEAAEAKPAPQPGRWFDRDCNAALNMHRIGESKLRLLELCWWPEQLMLPNEGKEYPDLGNEQLRDKPPKAQPHASLDVLGLALLAGLLGHQHGLDVGQHATGGDGDLAQQLAQLLVVAHGQLDVAGHDAGLLVVAGSVAGQLQHLGHQSPVGHDGYLTAALFILQHLELNLTTTPNKTKQSAAMAPKAAEKAPAKKAAPSKTGDKNKLAVAGDKKNNKKVAKVESYKLYIYKVLKQVHPDTGISSKAISILNSFVNDIFDKIASEASRLARYNKKPTVTSREIQTAVRLVLPGELAKHAVSEGTKAVTKFTSV
ncbi:hypothetical protein QJQ45_016512 [Haematococcus lacustris]|nr:hypothetical protein QJQ45_016512 [Haematococcus lacustris]